MKCDACDYFASPDHCCVEPRSVKPCPEIRTCDEFKYEAGVGEVVRLELERERERCARICADRAERLAATAEQYPAGTAACFAAEAREGEGCS